jgi:nitroreductase family protein
MNFLDLAKARYSVRSFKDTPITTEELDKILEAGRVAPSAKNIQSHRIYVLQSKEALDKINAVCSCIFGAKTVFLLCYDDDEVWKNTFDKSINSGDIDVSIVCTHMMLQAKELGIGSCWVGRFDHKLISETFDLPKNIIPVALLPVGYPSETANPAEKHTSRKELSETVIYL